MFEYRKFILKADAINMQNLLQTSMPWIFVLVCLNVFLQKVLRICVAGIFRKTLHLPRLTIVVYVC